MTTSQLAALSTSQIASISPSIIATANYIDFQALSYSQLRALTGDQLRSIPASVMTDLVYRNFFASTSSLTFSNEQLAEFTPSQAAAVVGVGPTNAISSNAEAILMTGYTADTIDSVSTQALTLVPDKVFARLTTSQVSGLLPNQLDALNASQIQAIQPAALSGLSLNTVRAIWENNATKHILISFTSAQLLGLSQEVKNYLMQSGGQTTTVSFNTEQEFAALTPAQIAAIPATTIATIPDSYWHKLAVAQVAALTQEQLTAITPISTFYQFSPDRIRAISPTKMAVFTPAVLRIFATASESTSDIINQFTAEQIANLPPDSRAYLSSQEYANTAKFKNAGNISPAVIKLLHPTAFSTIEDWGVSNYPSSDYWLTKDLSLLSTTQLQSLSTECIRQLRTSQIQTLTTAEIASLTHTQLAVITTRNLSALNSSQISALSRSQIAALNTAQLAVLSLSPVNLTSADVATLNPGMISILSTSVLQTLSTTSIANLTQSQVAALTPSQLSSFNSKQIAAIETVDIQAIEPATINSLNTSIVRALTTTQMTALTENQVAQLTPNQVRVLTTSQISAIETRDITQLSPQSVSVLSTTQLAALTTSQLNTLSNAGTVHVATTTNPTTGVTTTTVTPKQPPSDATDGILDREWAKVSFMMSDSRLSNYDDVSAMSQALKDDIANRYWSSANRKFTDTRIGGNVAVNSRPQFNRYSDIRIPGRLPNRKPVTVPDMSGNFGMGRYYSESYDDNAQTIYLRFGVPQYNSLFSFFTNAFNPGTAAFINTGRTKGLVYDIGNIVGTVFTAVTFPVVTAFVIGSRIFSNIFSKPTSKFYTMKPTMFMYWSAVDMMVNAMNVNRGLMPKFPGGDQSSQRIGDPFNYDSDFINKLHTKFPRVFNESGRIDIFSVALRAQKIANDAFMTEYEDLKNNRLTFEGYVRQADGSNDSATNKYVKADGEPTLVGFLSYVGKLQTWFGLRDGSKNISEPSFKINPGGERLKDEMQTDQSSTSNNPPSWAAEFIQYLDSELSQGGAFATFRVDNTGSVSESFTSSVMESDLSQKLNSTASQARQMSFSFAGGNLGDGMLASAIEGVANGVKDVALGALNGLTLGLSGSVEALIQGSYYDIPKTWQSSTTNLPKASYTMQLVSPYGHPLSQLQNIYIPLAMLLAAVLPRSTGKQTYGPPFLCQVWDRGRCQITLGMATSLSITRGTANLPFNNRGQTMAIDVSLEIEDLSSIMHMPIGTGSIWEMIKAGGTAAGLTSGGGLPMNDEDNILMNYLATITGLDLYNQLYPLPKARLALARTYAAAGKFSSPAYWASAVHDSATSGVLSYTPTGWGLNFLEIGQRGSDLVTSGTGL